MKKYENKTVYQKKKQKKNTGCSHFKLVSLFQLLLGILTQGEKISEL